MLAAHEPDFPTLRSELERKTIEEVQRLAHDFKVARISHDAFKAQLQTLWNCTAGLVDKGTMEIISSLINQPAAGMQKTDRIVYVFADDKGRHIVLTYHFGETHFLFKRIAPDGSTMETAQKVPADVVYPEREAMQRMHHLANGMKSAGYKVILDV